MLSDVAGTPRSAYAKGCWKMFAALSPSRTSTMKDSPVLRSLTATWTRLLVLVPEQAHVDPVAVTVVELAHPGCGGGRHLSSRVQSQKG